MTCIELNTASMINARAQPSPAKKTTRSLIRFMGRSRIFLAMRLLIAMLRTFGHRPGVSKPATRCVLHQHPSRPKRNQTRVRPLHLLPALLPPPQRQLLPPDLVLIQLLLQAMSRRMSLRSHRLNRPAIPQHLYHRHHLLSRLPRHQQLHQHFLPPMCLRTTRLPTQHDSQLLNQPRGRLLGAAKLDRLLLRPHRLRPECPVIRLQTCLRFLLLSILLSHRPLIRAHPRQCHPLDPLRALPRFQRLYQRASHH
mmetsp:Transcript_60371/g.99609  ORF Transcript_60371/g.99609 Transcript_60371/m.99609 type:complete len:253 (+) Transcript_60371:150-908(+)